LTGTPATPPFHTLALVALGAGALLLLAGVCGALSFLLVPIFETTNALRTNTALFSAAALALAYGAVLVGVGRGLRYAQASPNLHLPSPLWLLAGYLLVLGTGQTVLSRNLLPEYLFPAWHVLAALLVPLAALAFAARRLREISLRSMLAQFAWGGLVTTALALVFELIIGLLLLGLALAAIVLLLGLERTQALVDGMQLAENGPEEALNVLMGEPSVVVIAALAAIILFVVIVPLLEELLKGAGPAYLIARHRKDAARPLRGQVVLWGLAAGAGYAFTENLFNTQGAISGGAGVVNLWASAMLLRSGTSLMHMVATATVAVGWFEALALGKRARGLALFGGALTAHAAWNTGALSLGGVAAGVGTEGLGIALLALALLFLSGLFVVMVVGLVYLIRWAQPPPIEIITTSGTHLEIKG
jgi:hypothetical protein